MPRANASPRFAADVIRGARAHRRTSIVWRFAAAAAMVLMIVGGTYAAAWKVRQHRAEALRAERQGIERELQQVKAIADRAKPIVVLENGDTRLIVNHENPKETPRFYY